MGALLKRLATILALVVLAFAMAGLLEGSAPPLGSVPFEYYKLDRVQRDVVYCTHGGSSLTMDIFYPIPGNSPAPALMYIHGGGWYSGDKTTGAGPSDIPELVARGYLVVAVNYRLAPKYKFPAQIEDVSCAVRFIRTHADSLGIDPARIGAWGDSAGGHLVTLLGVTDAYCGFDCACGCGGVSDRVQAVVDIYGPTDLTAMYAMDNSPHIEHVFGTTDPESQLIKLASPVTYVSSDDPPFLIIHGEDDEVIQPDQSQALYQRLAEAGVPAELLVVKNCGHCFKAVGGDISPTRYEITRRMADFFDRYLKFGDAEKSVT